MAKTQTVISSDARKAMMRAKKHLALVLRRSRATRYHISQKSMGQILQTSAANVSRFERGQVEDLTFNQLFRFLAKMEPNFRIMVAADGTWTDESEMYIPDVPTWRRA